jgi:molecular chaperone DnaK (HSP70)
MSSNATNQAISAGAIGLDLGSNSLVVATVKRGNVEILTNEGSHRETQNIVGFGEHERFIGEAGSLQVISRSNTFKAL